MIDTKKKVMLLWLALLCVVMLSGCFCQHQWVDATCTAAKTCSLCEKTEGEPLGHLWEDATCAAPKTCSACAVTEGESLPHTWEEATCSAPKTCSICSATEGEALEHIWDGNANFQDPDMCTVCGAEGEKTLPYFEEVGLTVNVQEGVTYDYVTCPPFHEDLEAIAQLTISNFRIFESDKTHKAKEGYEWRAADVHIVFDHENFISGYPVLFLRSDFYVVSGLNFPGKFTVNHHGIEYTDCIGKIENDDFAFASQTGKPTTFDANVYFQVPIGYDGVVLAFFSLKTDLTDVSCLHEVDDPNLLIYRFA